MYGICAVLVQIWITILDKLFMKLVILKTNNWKVISASITSLSYMDVGSLNHYFVWYFHLLLLSLETRLKYQEEVARIRCDSISQSYFQIMKNIFEIRQEGLSVKQQAHLKMKSYSMCIIWPLMWNIVFVFYDVQYLGEILVV